MKISGIWKVIPFCAIGLLFIVNSSFVKNEATKDVPSTTVEQSMIASKTIDTVIIRGMTFKPEELHVQKGDVVIFINKDIVPHDVTDFPENKWTSETLERGDSWKREIGGTFEYYCSIHPNMKGKIIVDP